VDKIVLQTCDVPLGHIAKPRFHYGGFEETNNQFQAFVAVPIRKTKCDQALE